MTLGLSVADFKFLFEERRRALTSIPMRNPCCRPSKIYRAKSASGCFDRHACHADKFSGVWTMEILGSAHEDGVPLAPRERRSSVYLYLPLESIGGKDSGWEIIIYILTDILQYRMFALIYHNVVIIHEQY